MQNPHQISVLQIIAQFKGRLDDETVHDCRDMAEDGEWGIAFEKLCDDLFEFDIVPTQAEYDVIALIGKRMGMSPETWIFLAPPPGRLS
ncbi:MafI family immunity protein [Tateyamaria sp. ANG-S1]|uniref:MafI family immunity protein n=1 Tax=Tateyamaria sp. ANG-S1 TaxID=1577905 RepID=UPI00057FA7DD|nr:MafI family immunity protein [Tateyamaria sp. ANG-S1]KIC47749.1 hypothetical protein RA29_19240 [Tateyamaria sp. ANG-S1]